ncbi:unnamed protein product [Medioppia subpectinata]|uniref:protein-tyrosine-phosphatase n=1 Tax=Medioppia subpectinata TaxID=1979941 RepID=A0A7R9PTH1_9ACAR|nr:unnamed protein product [Medioppia subpectinata]CAG2100486.1 unnamed protein product [Medioppia subpectinata]
MSANDKDVKCAVINNQVIDWDDMNRIWGDLYLGGQRPAYEPKTLKGADIRTVLTVMDSPIPELLEHEDIVYHFIHAMDHSSQDLLTHFGEAYDIIDGAVTAGTGVYVHCAAGISRSATIVISYLMRKLRMTVTAALALVRKWRWIVGPNDGFMRQLDLFEAMDCRLVATDRRLRQYMLEMYVSFNGVQLDQYFERMAAVETGTDGLDLGHRYVCTGCGEGLFNEIHVIRNDGSDQYNDREVCGKVFIEPQPWMSELLPEVEVRDLPEELSIKCPQCRRVVAECCTIFSHSTLRLAAFDCDCGQHMDVKGLMVRMTDNAFNKCSND